MQLNKFEFIYSLNCVWNYVWLRQPQTHMAQVLGWRYMSQWTNKNKLKKNKQLMWLGVIRMEKLIALRITIPSANDFIYEP